MPDGLSGVIVASDLQGMSTSAHYGGESRLLGEVVAEAAFDLGRTGLIPESDSLGVLLCGDLYSAPGADQRGATGDVRPVWKAFGSMFRWVVGVSGNHDEFGSARHAERFFRSTEGLHLLDGDVLELDGIRIGGVGLVIGNPEKRGRRSEEDFMSRLSEVVNRHPDVLLLHEGPEISRRQRGNVNISDRLREAAVPMVISGHVYWEEPVGQLGSVTQVLNVDSRVLVLVEENYVRSTSP